MTKIKTLNDVFVSELKDLYSAEKQLLKALPKMHKKASNETLKEAIAAHLEETKTHSERLAQIESQMKIKLSGKTCKAMKGLIEEGSEVLEEESENDALIDSMLIGAARRVEHYEQAAYCTAIVLAKALGETKVCDLLNKTFEEEEAADKKLSNILVKEVLSECLECESEKPTASKTKKTSVREKIKSLSTVFMFAGALTITSGLAGVSYAEHDAAKTAPQVNSGGVNGNRTLTPQHKDMKPNNAAIDPQDHDNRILEDKVEDHEPSDVRDLSAVPTKRGNAEVSEIDGKLKEQTSRYEADNSGLNVRDRDVNQPTADRQDLIEDAELLAVVRREIVANSDLSVNGQNVKILADDGVVTLRGPVETKAEKDWIEATVIKVAPKFKVENRLEVLAN